MDIRPMITQFLDSFKFSNLRNSGSYHKNDRIADTNQTRRDIGDLVQVLTHD
jgi:hypothetical protein